MQTETLLSGLTPDLVVQSRRNLTIEGDATTDQITATAPDEATLILTQSGNTITIESDRELTLKVPSNASLRIERARGNADLRNLAGYTRIERVNGNLYLKHLGHTDANRVDGNLHAEHLSNGLKCDGVGGSANLQKITGSVAVSCGGTGDLQDVSGDVNISAGGSIRIRLREVAEARVAANAGGSIKLEAEHLRVIHFDGNAGSNIDCRLGPDLNATLRIADSHGFHNLTLGDGSGGIRCTSGGSVTVQSGDQTVFRTNGEERGFGFNGPSSGPSSGRSKTIPLGSSREVFFEVGVDVKVEGYDGTDVIVERQTGRVNLGERAGAIHVESDISCTARVPNDVHLHIQSGAAARVSKFKGQLSVEAGAHAHVREFTGQLRVEAGADAKVNFVPEGEGESSIHAGVSARCWLPQDANLNVTIRDSRGEEKLILGKGENKGRLSVEAGMHAKVMTAPSESASASGEEDVAFQVGFGKNGDFMANVSPEVEQQILTFTSQMTSAAQQFAQQFSSIPMPDWLKGEVFDMQRRVVDATARAQEKINRKIESAARRAERQAEKFSRRDAFTTGFGEGWNMPEPPTPPTAPRPPTSPNPPSPPEAPRAPEAPFAPSAAQGTPPASKQEPVSNEERMAILRMLEQKKITAEQAAQLLAAMGA